MSGPIPRSGPLAIGLAGVLLAAGCPRPGDPLNADPEADAKVRSKGCLRYTPNAAEVGTLPADLPELSGLAASRRYPDVFWAHNDSGNALELFALRPSGEIVARYTLEGVTAPDVEDVSVGPCSEGAAQTCVFLADTGDNLRSRSSVQLLKMPEPDVPGSGALEPESLPFRYPSGALDAEALVVDRRGVPYVISKVAGSLGEVFRLEGLEPGRTAQAVRVGEIRVPFFIDRMTTAADLHPDGERLLLRTYGRVWELRRAGATRIEDLVEVEPTEIPSAPQPQSEAIAYTASGDGYLLGSEGAGAALFRVTCAP